MRRAAIVGSGPNGLSAAIRLARAGVAVTVYEGRATVGGAASTAEVTLPGFHHDLGSSVYPTGVASPFFRGLPLNEFGLRWIDPDAPLAHPLDGGTAVMLEHSLARTAEGLGADGRAYLRLMQTLVEHWEALAEEVLGPVIHLPRHPLLMARFGMFAALPATVLARTVFRGERAQALFGGNAAHSVLPIESPFSAAVALVLAAAAHSSGWPIAAGGAQAISNALARYFMSLGGEIVTGRWIDSLAELQEETILCDVSPQQMVRLAGNALPAGYVKKLDGFRYGPGAFKIDWALSQAIPWTAKDCRRAATVHLGGTLEETAASERAPWKDHAVFVDPGHRPFVLLTQPSLFDPSRAPVGKHTAWGYCHVPNGFAGKVPEAVTVEQIEAQVERFAPGFRDCILARKVWSTATFEAWNPNLIGGDLSGGAMTIGQLVFRPNVSQYRTPKKGLYLCSASTPPGGGVHGMCGYHAASAALEDFKIG